MSDQSTQLGNYEIHRAWEGFASIRQRSSGEVMHSRTPPLEEAESLYVGQSNLAERLRAKDADLTLWDVGLGGAANSMAAIRCYEAESKQQPSGSLRIVSFENDLDPLRLAMSHRKDFPYLDHAAPIALLGCGQWRSPEYPGLSWELVQGDFAVTMKSAAPPDLIFYDMFSSACDGAPWDLTTFQRLLQACAGKATELITYTRSTANRAAMLAAGFYVAAGPAMALKEETTIALTPAAALGQAGGRFKLLEASWLNRWRRSAAKFPLSLPAGNREEFEGRLFAHPQFQNEA